MWSYVQMLSPLLTIALAAAVCFTVASYIMGHRECDERMWNLAYSLAQSGEHRNCQAIEWAITGVWAFQSTPIVTPRASSRKTGRHVHRSSDKDT
jgi:hypothetical protein